MTEVVGRLLGDGFALTGRACGSIIERGVRTIYRAPTPTPDSTPHAHTPGCAPADMVHDGFLVLSAAFWLTGRLPSAGWHALTNWGKTADSREEEIYLGCGSNWFSMVNQMALSTSALITPIPWYLAFQGAFTGATFITTTHPPNPPRYPDETWYFVAGVATDDNWLSKNLTHLESRFGQPVTGISSGTCGLPTDLITCLLNRNLCWTTQSVHQVVHRIAYDLNRTTKRIRIMAHSHGTLIAQLALEKLYDMIPTTHRGDMMKRLYIHTFAACAKDYPNHGYALIEHYANELDGMAKLGVLDGTYRTRYDGHVYTHHGVSGHLFNTDYSLQANDYTPIPASPALLSLAPPASAPDTSAAALLSSPNPKAHITRSYDTPAAPSTPAQALAPIPMTPSFGSDAPAAPPMDAPPLAPSFDAPPPPGPPAPPGPPGPPPPPPGPPMMSSASGGRAGLLAQIQAGKALKKAASPGPGANGAGGGGASTLSSPNGKPPGGVGPVSPGALTVQQQMAEVLAKRNAAKQAAKK